MRITSSLQCSVKKDKNKYKRSHVYAQRIYAGDNILLLFIFHYIRIFGFDGRWGIDQSLLHSIFDEALRSSVYIPISILYTQIVYRL